MRRRGMMRIRDQYFEWLFEHVKNGRNSYLKLSKLLDGIAFHWFLPNDGNREQDAIREREIFIDTIEHNFRFDEVELFYLEPVSVFEVMVALAKRIDYNLDVLGEPPRYSKWYEELLYNLNIDAFNDKAWSDIRHIEHHVQTVIDKLLYRKYDRYGNGSFFPLRNRPRKDMARTEIWYQMMAYLDEKY